MMHRKHDNCSRPKFIQALELPISFVFFAFLETPPKHRSFSIKVCLLCVVCVCACVCVCVCVRRIPWWTVFHVDSIEHSPSCKDRY
jgi:hypothetical protein